MGTSELIILVKARSIQLSSARTTEILADIAKSNNDTLQNFSDDKDVLETTSSLPQDIMTTTELYGNGMESSEMYRIDATPIKQTESGNIDATTTEEMLSASATSTEPIDIISQDGIITSGKPHTYSTEGNNEDVESLPPIAAPQTAIEQTTSWSTLMYKWKTEAAVVSTPTTHLQNPVNYRTIQHVVDYDAGGVSEVTEDGFPYLLNLEQESPIEIQIPISEDDPLIVSGKDIKFEEVPLNEKNINVEEYRNIGELHHIEVRKTHDCEKDRYGSDGEFNYLKYQPDEVDNKFYKQLPYLIANSPKHLKSAKQEGLAWLPSASKANKFIKNSKRDLYGAYLNDLHLKNQGTNALDPKYTYESSAEKEEKLQKALERFTQALTVFTQMDNYFSTRLKTTIKKLAKLCEEEGPII